MILRIGINEELKWNHYFPSLLVLDPPTGSIPSLHMRGSSKSFQIMLLYI